jgi:hypothetical protein
MCAPSGLDGTQASSNLRTPLKTSQRDSKSMLMPKTKKGQGALLQASWVVCVTVHFQRLDSLPQLEDLVP